MESSDASLMTIDEIINDPGEPTFNLECNTKIESYLALLSSRAPGSISTSAQWQRDFVRGDPLHRRDSLVGNTIAYDLRQAQMEISRANGKVGLVGREMFVGRKKMVFLGEKKKLFF